MHTLLSRAVAAAVRSALRSGLTCYVGVDARGLSDVISQSPRTSEPGDDQDAHEICLTGAHPDAPVSLHKAI